jgi:nonsense-mediated mRNA decay protein 3
VAKLPCPHCGKEVRALIEGMCEDCYFKRHPLVSVERCEVLRCKYCGAVYLRGRWLRARSRSDVILKVLEEYGRVAGAVERVEVREREGGADVELAVRGSPHPALQPRELTYRLSLRYVYDICNTCREVLSKREAALLQIRATPRALGEVERKKIMSIIEHELFKLRDKNVGFVSEVKELRNGLDVHTTSPKLAQHLAHALHKHFPSSVTVAAKAVGFRGGRRIYHMTYSLHILTYRPGDVIRIGSREAVVVSVGNKFVEVRDVSSGKHELLSTTELLSDSVVLVSGAPGS